MGNNEPVVDQSDLRIRGSYGLSLVPRPICGIGRGENGLVSIVYVCYDIHRIILENIR